MNLLGKPIYRFEDVEIDGSRGCLNRNGQEQHLRQQTFQVLLYLIDQRERIVTKEELLHNIWHDTAVTDNALVQCIVDIRKALGDDRHQPRFIRTVPKVGYRFIGIVEEHSPIGDASKPNNFPDLERQNEAHVIDRDSDPLRSKWIDGLVRRRMVVAAAVAAILLVAAAYLITRIALFGRSGQQHAEITLPQVPGKKSVAVMYFENQSANTELNWLREGLADMLITDLARSNKLTVLSRQQLHLLLERTGRSLNNIVRLDDALDIGRRSHAETVVLGSFASVGNQVRIDAQLYDTDSGQLIAAERLIVDAPGQILTNIDLLSLKLTTQLGLGPTELSKKGGLAEVMTDNLEAYRFYSLGLEKAQAFENVQAIRLLEKAIELDPKFAMAHAVIGYAYAVMDFSPEKGRPYLEKAFQLSDRLSERDKLYINAWYAIAREDYPSAIRTFRQIIAQYPFEVEAYRRLGRLLFGEEQSEESLRVLKQGLTIDPDAKDLYNALGVVLLGLGRYDEAIAAHQRYVALAPDEPNSHDSFGMSYQRSGRYQEAMSEYERALQLNPEFEPAIIHLGDVCFQQGRYREATRHYQRYIQVTRSDHARALASGAMAYVFLRRGDIQKAQEAAQAEMRYERSAVWNSLLVAIESKDLPRFDKLKNKLFERLPNPERGARSGLRSYHYFLGYLALKRGDKDEAITQFKEALRHLPPTSGVDGYEDCLANAYLEIGRLEEAIIEYNRILSLNPTYPLAHYHLAQALERKGEREQARASYEHFLRVWKNADPELPQILNAKQKMTALS